MSKFKKGQKVRVKEVCGRDRERGIQFDTVYEVTRVVGDREDYCYVTPPGHNERLMYDDQLEDATETNRPVGFHVGDKVVRIEPITMGACEMKVGDIGTVTKVHANGGVDLKEWPFSINAAHDKDKIALVQEGQSWKYPDGSFRIGARVRMVNGDSSHAKVGDTGTVIQDGNGCPYVRWDKCPEKEDAMYTKELELLPRNGSEAMPTGEHMHQSWSYAMRAPERLEWKTCPMYISTEEAFGSKQINRPKGIKRMLQKLSATLKRVLSASMQAQYKAGFRNGDLALTTDGRTELLELLAAKYDAELTARAEEVIVEAKDSNE